MEIHGTLSNQFEQNNGMYGVFAWLNTMIGI